MIIINKFFIRASYPNYFMVKLYVDKGRYIFEKSNEREGNKPGTVIYSLKDNDNIFEIAPRWYDIYYLLNNNDKDAKHFLSLLISEEQGDTSIKEELESLRNRLYLECKNYVEDNPLIDNDDVVTMLTDKQFSVEEISHKGCMLMDLTSNCYAVPDFCIVSSYSFNERNNTTYLYQAVHDLEIMTKTKLGSDINPLVFAVRSAMPQYIPGLMPTILNIGVTHKAYQGLCKQRDKKMANRIYLNTLHNIIEMMPINNVFINNDKELSEEKQEEKIARMEQLICMQENGEKLINDAFYQVAYTTDCIRDFYDKNQDLILTFMQGKHAYPSLILQKMVWTIGNNESYPGVLHSRHSRTGIGVQIESYQDIFGEEIMTGDISSNDMEYFDRQEIKTTYPAIYHFDPLLPKLEKRCLSPVTIEFAVETTLHKVSLFAVLQLNKSELTGRAALLSSIDLYKKGVISSEKVVELIRPYHLRQIVSDSIDDSSFNELKFFGKGVNVLPRTATTAVICFSTAQAREFKKQGLAVCLCKERFVPEDTIILNEIDAILSITPAAIHVVTACRGYGIPAFLNLRSNGIYLKNNQLINADGLTINEGEWITLSSKRQSLYIGKAKFRPARFMKYLNGADLKMEPKEERVFRNMKIAYEKYQEIVNSTSVNYIYDIDTLARLIRNDLQENPTKAKRIVNQWYQVNSDKYIQQVLDSKMGSHQDQSRVYELLEYDKKVDFYRKAISKCLINNISGLNAGSFMLGRFAAQPLPKQFWHSLKSLEVAFILNEYVLYEKYLQVLDEVGETKLTRVHTKITNDGFDFSLIFFDMYNFVTLIISMPDWYAINNDLNILPCKQSNTLLLIKKLSCPIEEIFDLSKPWIKEKVDKLAEL